MGNEKFCPTCGRANPLASRYCGNCGQMLPAGSVLLQQPEERRGWSSEEDTILDRPWQRLDKIAEETGKFEEAEARERSVVEEVVADTEAQATCLACGRESDAFSFCSHCGADLPPGARRVNTGAGTKPQQSRPASSAPSAQQAQQTRRTGRAKSVAAVASSSVGTGDPAACALLSFFFPGLGQILNKQVTKGVFLILAAYIAVAYLGWSSFGMPMLIGRILVAVDAHRIARRRRAGRSIEEWEWGLNDK